MENKLDIELIARSCAEALRLQFTAIKNKTMYLERLDTCKKCPIYNNGRCGNGSVITIDDKIYYSCNCMMVCKAALPENQCPNNFWNPV